VFTDNRRGFNGKTAFVKLIEQALGTDYACPGPKNMLYKSDFVKDANDHQSVMLSLGKKRMIVFEETDGSVKLDEQKLKELNGGDLTSLCLRQANSKDVVTMNWITKMIICCNEGRFPKLDVSDAAATQRILAIKHRSRFCDATTYELEQHREYTYRMDTGMSKNYRKWRPYMMRWCLEGLARYWEQELDNVPRSIAAFQHELIASKNPVHGFLEEEIERSIVATDYVVRADLYCSFNSKCRDTQSDRRSRVEKSAFMMLLTQYCGSDCHKARHAGRVDVFTQWRTSDSE
jgi:phage/plasmid-associated DNA primase